MRCICHLILNNWLYFDWIFSTIMFETKAKVFKVINHAFELWLLIWFCSFIYFILQIYPKWCCIINSTSDSKNRNTVDSSQWNFVTLPYNCELEMIFVSVLFDEYKIWNKIVWQLKIQCMNSLRNIHGR